MFRSSAKAPRGAARIPATVLVSLLILSGCGGINFPRFGSEGAVSTRVCGIYIDGKTRAAHLRIELAPSGLPGGALVEVEFENPDEGKPPLTAARVYKGEQTLVIFSPPVKGVRPRGYEVVARIYASADKKQALGVHTQICQSLVDQRELGRASRGRDVALAGFSR